MTAESNGFKRIVFNLIVFSRRVQAKELYIPARNASCPPPQHCCDNATGEGTVWVLRRFCILMGTEPHRLSHQAEKEHCYSSHRPRDAAAHRLQSWYLGAMAISEQWGF